MGFPLLKKLAITIALIDLLLAVNDSRNVGRFFLLLTMSSTFDLVPDNVLHKHCEEVLLTKPNGFDDGHMCAAYAEILLVGRAIQLQQIFSLENNHVNNPNVSIYFDHDRKYSCKRGDSGGGEQQETFSYSSASKEGKDLSAASRPQGHDNQLTSQEVHQLKATMSGGGGGGGERPKRQLQSQQQFDSKMYVVFANATTEALSGSPSSSSSNNDNQQRTSNGLKREDAAESTKVPYESGSRKNNVLVSSSGAVKYQKYQQTGTNKLLAAAVSPSDTKYSSTSRRMKLAAMAENKFGLSMIRRYPRLVTRFLEEGMLLQWPCVIQTTQLAFRENNISSTASPAAQKIKFHIELDPFRLDVFRNSEERLRAAQQLLFDSPWMVMYNLHATLPGSFTRAFIVITLYTWLWGTVIALMLLIGAITDDQTTLHGWIIFNILYSLLQFMVDQWIHGNISPYKSRLVIWLFLIYSVYKPTSALIGFSRWSECVDNKTTWVFPDAIYIKKTERNNITVTMHKLNPSVEDGHLEAETDTTNNEVKTIVIEGNREEDDAENL